ncbi:hypothetical protein WR25_14399, partial [Diploscapter pachys]
VTRSYNLLQQMTRRRCHLMNFMGSTLICQPVYAATSKCDRNSGRKRTADDCPDSRPSKWPRSEFGKDAEPDQLHHTASMKDKATNTGLQNLIILIMEKLRSQPTQGMLSMVGGMQQPMQMGMQQEMLMQMLLQQVLQANSALGQAQQQQGGIPSVAASMSNSSGANMPLTSIQNRNCRAIQRPLTLQQS